MIAVRFEIINKIKKEKGWTNEDIARVSGVPKATVDKITSGKTQSPNYDTVEAIARALGCSMDDFRTVELIKIKKAPAFSAEAKEFAKKYDSLDAHGKKLLGLILNEEMSRLASPAGESEEPYETEKKIIPLYFTPAAAGYASPAMGEDYDNYEVAVSSPADFAARIDGDSMEPYIKNGSVILVKRQQRLNNGDVGLFFVDGDMKCKQYIEDGAGNIKLLSLNRARADADVTVSAASGVTVTCYGKVLLDKTPPVTIA